MGLPNILHESVPSGPDDSGNVTVSTFGEPPTFDFKLRDHVDVLTERWGCSTWRGRPRSPGPGSSS